MEGTLYVFFLPDCALQDKREQLLLVSIAHNAAVHVVSTEQFPRLAKSTHTFNLTHDLFLHRIYFVTLSTSYIFRDMEKKSEDGLFCLDHIITANNKILQNNYSAVPPLYTPYQVFCNSPST